jgi:hypothetical protein
MLLGRRGSGAAAFFHGNSGRIGGACGSQRQRAGRMGESLLFFLALRGHISSARPARPAHRVFAALESVALDVCAGLLGAHELMVLALFVSMCSIAVNAEHEKAKKDFITQKKMSVTLNAGNTCSAPHVPERSLTVRVTA